MSLIQGVSKKPFQKLIINNTGYSESNSTSILNIKKKHLLNIISKLIFFYKRLKVSHEHAKKKQAITGLILLSKIFFNSLGDMSLIKSLIAASRFYALMLLI